MTDSLRHRCPGCGTALYSRRGGEWCLRNAIVKLGTDGQVLAKCPDCKHTAPVPWLRVEPATTPTSAGPPGSRRRVVVRRQLDRGTDDG